MIPVEDRLIVALDVPNAEAAKQLVTALGSGVRFYKIGLELAMSGDYFELMHWLLKQNKKVFADLKFFDVPATVASATRQIAAHGAHMLTVHGNQAIMEAAAAEKGDLQLLAVTVLTSLDRGDLDDLGFDCDVEQLVLSRARRAFEAGCDGVVCSGFEVAGIRTAVGNKIVAVTPGIRPVDNRPVDDQKRVVTPTDAIQRGADYLVVGRPIRQADNPATMAAQLQAEIAAAVASRSAE